MPYMCPYTYATIICLAYWAKLYVHGDHAGSKHLSHHHMSRPSLQLNHHYATALMLARTKRNAGSGREQIEHSLQ